MKSTRHLLPAIILALLLAPAAFAGAKITIDNKDGTGEGFNDATPATPVGGNNGTTVGQQRLIAFQRAAEVWASILDSDVEIVIDARFDPLECGATSAVLGSAGPVTIASDFPGAASPNTWYHAALANRLAGEDLDTTRLDIRARFNSSLGNSGCLPDRGWYYGLDNQHGTKTDLIVVLLHEFGHGLGFSEFVDSDTGEFIEGRVDAYASFLLDTKTGKRWSEMTNAERLASMVNTDGLVLDGPTLVADVPTFLEGNGPPQVVVTSPPSIAATYSASRAQFGGSLGAGPFSGTFILATDPSDGAGESTTDGCSPITNAAEVNGKLALVDRGTCTFVTKAKNLQDAGALGVIVVNNEDNNNQPPLGGSDPTITVPIIGISKPNGATIKGQLANGVTGSIGLGPATALAGADTSNRPFVYAPSTFAPGSSTSHFDTSANPNLLMEPSINGDLDSTVDLTESYFRDAGWFALSTMTVTMRDSFLSDADADGKADPGDTIRYALSIANTAGSGATGVVLTYTPDENTAIVVGSVQTSSGTVVKGNGPGDTSVEIALTGLKPEATATAQFDVVVKSGIASAATNISAQATLDGTNFDPVASDDPDTGTAADATLTPLDLNPIKVEKVITSIIDADSSGGTTPGDTIIYAITIRNDGTTTVNDATLSDTPDPYTTLVSGSVATSQGTITAGNGAGDPTATISLGAIAPGATASVALSARITPDLPSRIVLISNQASVASSNFATVLSNDPRNSVPSDPTSVSIQQTRPRPIRR